MSSFLEYPVIVSMNNITHCFLYQFFHYQCFIILVLSLDAMDTTGEQHLQIEHNIFKRRLDLSGKPIEEPKKTGMQ